MKEVSAAILGASGFAGAELVRLLSTHPAIKVKVAGASSRAGSTLGSIFPSLDPLEEVDLLPLKDAVCADVDIVFSSLPHGQSMQLFGKDGPPRVVDLAADFRLKDPDLYPVWYGSAHTAPESLSEWVYGLSEFHAGEIAQGSKVANPGCYASATILALGPLLAEGLIRPDGIHIDGKSGISGAGRASGEGLDFSSTNENVKAYKPVGHGHIAEIEQELSLVAGANLSVSFVPHLIPMTRGILITAVSSATRSLDDAELTEAVNNFYSKAPFVRVLGQGRLPETKRLSGANFAEIAVRFDSRTNKVFSFCAIDNLGKGAAGQAIQNANLMLGFEETAGLDQTAVVP